MMDERDRLIELSSKRDQVFALWRHAPKVNLVVAKLTTENPNLRGLEALLRAAFEAGWSGGYIHANERKDPLTFTRLC
jgi:hypothetical protein